MFESNLEDKINFEDRFRGCKKVNDKLKQADCLFDLLYDITVLQDKVQLSIYSANFSQKLALNLVNSANAFILNSSRLKGDIRPMVEHGYIKKHIDRINISYNTINWNYNNYEKDKISYEDMYGNQDKFKPIEFKPVEGLAKRIK